MFYATLLPTKCKQPHLTLTIRGGHGSHQTYDLTRRNAVIVQPLKYINPNAPCPMIPYRWPKTRLNVLARCSRLCSKFRIPLLVSCVTFFNGIHYLDWPLGVVALRGSSWRPQTHAHQLNSHATVAEGFRPIIFCLATLLGLLLSRFPFLCPAPVIKANNGIVYLLR